MIVAQVVHGGEHQHTQREARMQIRQIQRHAANANHPLMNSGLSSGIRILLAPLDQEASVQMRMRDFS